MRCHSYEGCSNLEKRSSWGSRVTLGLKNLSFGGAASVRSVVEFIVIYVRASERLLYDTEKIDVIRERSRERG